MDARRESDPTPVKNRTTVEPKSEREFVVTRTFNGPARLVFEAWTKPELLKRWWTPKSTGMSMLSCEADVRVGGRYRFVFRHGASEPMAFFGRYLEVTPHSRLVWTNEEGDGGEAITTVTFEEKGGKTFLVVRELHPSKEARDAAIAGEGLRETFEQLDELLVTLVVSRPRAWEGREVISLEAARNGRFRRHFSAILGREPGGVAEWSKAAVLKTAVPVTVPGVRIPSPPQKS